MSRSSYNLTKRATRANERKAEQHLNKLETIAQEAYNSGSRALAADIWMKLYEHAVGKPKERKEVQQFSEITVRIQAVPPPLNAEWRLLTQPESKIPLPGEAPEQPDLAPSKQQIVESVSSAFKLAGEGEL